MPTTTYRVRAPRGIHEMEFGELPAAVALAIGLAAPSARVERHFAEQLAAAQQAERQGKGHYDVHIAGQKSRITFRR